MSKKKLKTISVEAKYQKGIPMPIFVVDAFRIAYLGIKAGYEKENNLKYILPEERKKELKDDQKPRDCPQNP